MAWYPGATKMELQPESDQQPAIRPTQFIVHSVVAPWTAQRILEYWRDSTNLESHFGLGYEGDLGQYIGTETRADANASANRRPDGSGAVSIETASNTSASDPWTPEQIEALIELGVWLHQRHGIPLRICESPDDPGFGYHRLFPEWSTSGTACPGHARVQQFIKVVFPGIVARATGQTKTSEEQEEPMPEFTGLGHGQDVPLTDGGWKRVFWKREYKDGPGEHIKGGSVILHGPARLTGHAYFRVTGLTEAGEVQARVVEMEDDREVHEHPIVELGHTRGDDFLCLGFTQQFRAGRKLAVQIRYVDPDATDVQLAADSYVKVLSWKES